MRPLLQTVLPAVLASAVLAISGASLAANLTTLYNFQGGSDGAYPIAGLVMDRSGNLYGTTVGGNIGQYDAGGYGTVFQLAPPTTGGVGRKPSSTASVVPLTEHFHPVIC